MDERVWKHTPEMGEISGFGGGYEEACQQMLHQGVAYLVSLGERRPEFEVETYRGVFGICDLTGPDAEGLEAAVMAGDGFGATGAMHQAVMMRLRFIAEHGWERYVAECVSGEGTDA